MADEENRDITPIMLRPEVATQLISQALRVHKEAESRWSKWLKLWPIVFFLLTVVCAAVSFYYQMNGHVEEKAEHFLPDVEGEKKRDFAKVVLVKEKLEAQTKEIGRILEIQQMKQELQMRQALQEYRENFGKFKRSTQNMAEELGEQ